MVTDSHDVAGGAALKAEAVYLRVNLPVYSLLLHSRFAPQFIEQRRHNEALHAWLPGQIHSVSCEAVQQHSSLEGNFALPLATLKPCLDFVFDRLDFVYWLCWEWECQELSRPFWLSTAVWSEAKHNCFHLLSRCGCWVATKQHREQNV